MIKTWEQQLEKGYKKSDLYKTMPHRKSVYHCLSDNLGQKVNIYPLEGQMERGEEKGRKKGWKKDKKVI